MKKMARIVGCREDAIALMNIALEHEWAVSFEYLIHAYSMPKGRFLYEDPILRRRTDVRAQTIQIGIDEMYHAWQLGIEITRLGGAPSFRADAVVRFPKVIDNLKRNKRTEDLVADLYRNSPFREGRFPEVRNMALNISVDEVRHARQFQAMVDALEAGGHSDSLLLPSCPEVDAREDVALLHEIMRRENELTHRYLRYAILFSGRQDLAPRLFKNSIDHMRHWDKNAGHLVRLGTVLRIENGEAGPDGREVSRKPMPGAYPGRDRRAALRTLGPAEHHLIDLYEKLVPLAASDEIREALRLQLALKREHVFTQDWLAANAKAVKGLA